MDQDGNQYVASHDSALDMQYKSLEEDNVAQKIVESQGNINIITFGNKTDDSSQAIKTSQAASLEVVTSP